MKKETVSNISLTLDGDDVISWDHRKSLFDYDYTLINTYKISGINGNVDCRCVQEEPDLHTFVNPMDLKIPYNGIKVEIYLKTPTTKEK